MRIKKTSSAEDLEQAVLGALLVERDSYLEIAHILSFKSFYNPINAMIFDAISLFKNKNLAVDLYTIAEYLNGKVEPMYLADLTQKIGTAAHIVSHARIVQDRYIERSIIEMGREILAIGGDDDIDLLDKIMTINQKMMSVLELTDNSEQNVKMDDVMKKSIDEASVNYNNFKNGKTSGVDTEIKSLTNVLGGGLHKSELVIIGARPGMGKTAMLIHLAKAAAKQSKSVQIYSIEMKDVEMGNRLIVGEGGINPYHLRNGNINSDEWKRLDRNVANIMSLPIWINDRPGQTIDGICINARKMHRRGMCDVIFIDYLQIVSTPSAKGRTRSDLIGEITRKAKGLAKELNIPIVLLSQLSRDSARSSEKVPKLTDLRDSGEIEQDADVVVLMHRPAYYGEESYSVGNTTYETKGLGILIVAKNRHGVTVQIPFSHNDSMTEITDYQKKI